MINGQRALIGRGVPLVKFRDGKLHVTREPSTPPEGMATFTVRVGVDSHLLAAKSWFQARHEAFAVYGPDAKVEPLGGGK
jgi:hypothetical protein